jgi:hypothetical protein
MNRDQWEVQFRRKLKQKLGIEPGQIKFHWRGYYNQRFTPEGAIAHLVKTHEMYPQLGILPESAQETAGTTPELSEGLGKYV